MKVAARTSAIDLVQVSGGKLVHLEQELDVACSDQAVPASPPVTL